MQHGITSEVIDRAKSAVPTSLNFLLQLHLFNSPRPKVHQNYDRTISETKLYPLEASPRLVA